MGEEKKGFWQWLVRSSADPSKIALTIKSAGPFILAIAAFFKLDIVDGDLDQLGFSIIGIVSGITFFYGFIRKVVLSYRK